MKHLNFVLAVLVIGMAAGCNQQDPVIPAEAELAGDPAPTDLVPTTKQPDRDAHATETASVTDIDTGDPAEAGPGGTLAVVPSRILSKACCTPSPETSRVMEGLSALREILSTSSM